MPVSAATILQQDPFMLFNELESGIHCMLYKCSKMVQCKYTGPHAMDLLSLDSVRPLFTSAFLTDEVSYSIYGDSSNSNNYVFYSC